MLKSIPIYKLIPISFYKTSDAHAPTAAIGEFLLRLVHYEKRGVTELAIGSGSAAEEHFSYVDRLDLRHVDPLTVIAALKDAMTRLESEVKKDYERASANSTGVKTRRPKGRPPQP
jgi:hypothetical protein